MNKNMKNLLKISLLLSIFIFSGCDKIDKTSAEVRLQKLYPNCQVFHSEELERFIKSDRVSIFIIKTQNNKVYYISFIGSGMGDPVECFPVQKNTIEN